jgi:hypothetical protein
MIGVETGDSRGRNEMERWYGRAMAAWPDNRGACELKLTWLAPKWHGSAKEVVAFGRELRDGGRWEANLPLLLVEAHWAASEYSPDGRHGLPNPGYFTRTPAAWDDVKSVYDEFFRRAQGPLRYHRTRYAAIAAWTGHWAEADAMFKAVGSEVSHFVLYDGRAIEQLRQTAAANALRK